MDERSGELSVHDDAPAVDDTEARLAALVVESDLRSAELKLLAASVPAAMSRRAVVVAMFRDLWHAPDKPTVVRRVTGKALRVPRELFGRARR